jgi:hypothetical protein
VQKWGIDGKQKRRGTMTRPLRQVAVHVFRTQHTFAVCRGVCLLWNWETTVCITIARASGSFLVLRS